MNALILAAELECDIQFNLDEAAVTLRKQHEAIVTLRAALLEIYINANDRWADEWCGAIADVALEATKEFE